jgi:hypothetical protein
MNSTEIVDFIDDIESIEAALSIVERLYSEASDRNDVIVAQALSDVMYMMRDRIFQLED